jgi:hypothetical protein
MSVCDRLNISKNIVNSSGNDALAVDHISKLQIIKPLAIMPTAVKCPADSL